MTSDIAKTVLYVEDHEPNVFLMEAIFSPRADIIITSAPTGTLGLALARQTRPQLILLDLNLPDMHGEQFIEHLRAIPEIAAIPVIVLTADVGIDPHGKLASLGIAEFISKPFDIDHLERMVDLWLRR